MLVEDFLHSQGDDNFVAAIQERFAFRQVQTARRRLGMTHRHGRNINANPTRGFSWGRRTMLRLREAHIFPIAISHYIRPESVQSCHMAYESTRTFPF